MTTIVNGATKARLVWILAQLGNVGNWIRPDGEPILNGAAAELQDIINTSTEPAVIAPTTEVQVMTADDVAQVIAECKAMSEDQVAQVSEHVSALINSVRSDILGDIQAAIQVQTATAPTAPAATDPAPTATA